MVLMHCRGGAVGQMWTSSIHAGSMGSPFIRVTGAKASLVWRDSQPNELWHERQNQPSQGLHHGMPYPDTLFFSSLPSLAGRRYSCRCFYPYGLRASTGGEKTEGSCGDGSAPSCTR